MRSSKDIGRMESSMGSVSILGNQRLKRKENGLMGSVLDG